MPWVAGRNTELIKDARRIPHSSRVACFLSRVAVRQPQMPTSVLKYPHDRSDAQASMKAAAHNPRTPFFEELQSVRGLAALLVVVHHCTFYYEFGKHRIWSEVLLNAHAAVVLFFVLSGFVLAQTLSAQKLSLSNIGHFYIKRVFRIYPALWIACCFGLAYIVLLHNVPLSPITSGWLNRGLRTSPIDLLNVVESFLGTENAFPVSVWTVYIELLGSTLLPFLLLAAAKSRLAFLIASGALLFLSIGSGVRMHLDAGVYLVDFALGASIVVFKDRLRGSSQSKKSAIGLGRYITSCAGFRTQAGAVVLQRRL